MNADQEVMTDKRQERRTIRAARKKGHGSTTPAPNSATGERLLIRPRPLLDPDRKLLVVFSPKSACSTVAIWFFNIIGHLRAAQDFDSFPHVYRGAVYNRSRFYERALLDDHSAYTVIRVVRDPHDRVTSSFRHALKTGYTDDAIAEAVAGYDAADRKLSFGQYLDFLDTQNLASCNPHHARQLHPIEELLKPRFVINITDEDLFTRLNEVEAELGLPRTDFARIDWLHRVDARRSVLKSAEGELSGQPLSHKQALNGPWPSAKALLSPEARHRISALYAADIDRYAKPRDPTDRASGGRVALDDALSAEHVPAR